MKQIKINLLLCVLAGIIVLLATCKKKITPAPAEGNPVAIFEIKTLLDDAHDKFYANGALTSGNYKQALMLTADWVKTLPEVEFAGALEDSLAIMIRMKSGLRTYYMITEVDAQGKPFFRGSGSGGKAQLEEFMSDPTAAASSTKKIPNKKILFFVPTYTEFEYAKEKVIENLIDKIKAADAGFEFTVLKDHDAKSTAIPTFGDYGAVIIDAHGVPDGFLVGDDFAIDSTVNTAEKLSEALRKIGGAEFESSIMKGHFGFIGGDIVQPGVFNWYQNPGNRVVHKLYASGTYINTMPSWPGTLILGNFCFSGWGRNPYYSLGPISPIRTAFTNRNLISYYAYCQDLDFSGSATDKICKMMEDSLLTALILDGDSTGDAHRDYTGGLFLDVWRNNPRQPQNFRQFSDVHYSYDLCGKPLKDSRDGQEYKTVCIGKQVWMAQNLNYDVVGSYCYSGSSGNCSTYGRLYTWSALMNGKASSTANPSGVQGVCPNGWHVPSVSEWDQMIQFAGGNFYGGGKLKKVAGWAAPNTGATDVYKFSALPGGYRDSVGVFHNLMTNGAWWTAKESSVKNAHYVAMGYNNTVAGFSNPPKLSAMSCRCVKD